MKRDDGVGVLLVASAAAIVVGCGLVWLPLAFIVGGCLGMASAILLTVTTPEPEPEATQ